MKDISRAGSVFPELTNIGGESDKLKKMGSYFVIQMGKSYDTLW